MFTGFSHGNSKDSCPRKDPNVVGLLQGIDRVVDDLEQEITNDFANSIWRGAFGRFPS